MVVPDPVDARLLAVLAESGRAAVHEIAQRLGMDPREAAMRLITLSGSGLPLLVGVEGDPNGLRRALANAAAYGNYFGPPPSGPYAVHQSGPHQVQQPYGPQGPSSQPFPAQPQAAQPQTGPQATWGPPQSAGWVRADQPQPQARPVARTGKIGSTLEADSLEGAHLQIQLVEVVDPADFLFTAAGYKLAEGERAVVVHTEVTNASQVSYTSLPDMYLVLVTKTGETVTKAPVSLSSRPAHKLGVQPGETAGGHTVFVLPDATEVIQVRWSVRPEVDLNTLVWTIED
ncbi:AsnC-type helix-turn-helix domain-containing protein [Lentzea fradiae]|uniref:AsnC-type helix-turn-helix domain-containing protein n=1 Tax=Lentzea fradiae TaxID=200378 RepID=A0A1G7T6T9_9PSEU|nr:AsnC family protein [Lentzea fradiae]SDG30995.1 AsnC-type helix-turn-helix domain-containing protein [Lentzea fradiae]